MSGNTCHAADKHQSGNSNQMKMTLKRKVRVKRYPVIATVVFKRERKDLKSLLAAIQKHPTTMPRRLTQYLIREGLWSPDFSELTEKGREVFSTGYMEVKERGLYHIWYTANDPLLETRPLLIQRGTAFIDGKYKPQYKTWKSGVDASQSEFAVSVQQTVDVLDETYDGKDSIQLQQTMPLVSLLPQVLCSSESESQLDLEWRRGVNHSTVFLKGRLEFPKKGKHSASWDLDLEIEGYGDKLNAIMESLERQFDASWNPSAQRLASSLDTIRQFPDAIERFELRQYTLAKLETHIGLFDIDIQHLPLKPRNNADAEQWQNAWLKAYHAANYRDITEAQKAQSLWLDHPAVSDFDLPLKMGQTLLGISDRERHPEAYWHTAAIMDLSPTYSKKLRLPITLINGEKLDVRGFVRQLTDDEPLLHVIYSDRYVHNRRQFHNLRTIANYFGDADGLLLTLETLSGLNEQELPENWYGQTMIKEHDNHGRYWIFIGQSQTYCWECTSGLDCFEHKGGLFIIEGTPCFTPKSENELPRYLQDAMKMKTAEVL